MKVAILNTRDLIGGAAIAANRIHHGLIELGVDSKMLVDIKNSNDNSVILLKGNLSSKIRSRIDFFPQRLFKLHARSLSFVRSSFLKELREINPDLVHLHWINNGFVSVEQLSQIDKPIVWTLHDMWPFSDARHYVDEIESPEFRSGHFLDKWVWGRKQKVYRAIENLHIVTPSNWLAHLASESLLLGKRPINVIGNGIDTNFYKPDNKHFLRKKLGISPDDINILFSGYNAVADERKGFKYLLIALEYLSRNADVNVTCSILGSDDSPVEEKGNLKTKYFGQIQDQALIREIYAACDLFVLPSLQDNLPNTVLEAMSCGCPTVAFNIGGISDMIDHEVNGYLANPKDAYALASGILWYIYSKDKGAISNAARDKVKENFELSRQSQKYIDLYQSILAK